MNNAHDAKSNQDITAGKVYYDCNWHIYSYNPPGEAWVTKGCVSIMEAIR